jgi:hypothetical protein
MGKLAIVTIAALTLLSAACIKRDSAATWYLDNAGHVTWSILERDIRSDASARLDRDTEESTFLAAVKSNQHGAAKGLARLGASQLKVTILQDKPPFTVLTEGQFPGLDELGQRLITRFGLSGASEVIRDGNTWTWSMHISDPHATSGPESDGDELADLLGDRLTVALREGRFLSATGFALDNEGRIATLKSDDKLTADESGTMRFQLRWEIK